MHKKSRLILFVIGFAALMAVSSFAYQYLTERYKNSETEIENEQKSDGAKLSETNELPNDKIEAPDFTVYDVDGKAVKLSDFKGTPVVLNFWASWCPPCRNEMPYFNEASKTCSKKEIAILMINLTDGQRETKEDAVSFMKQNNYEAMQLLLDSDQDAAYKYQISSIPRTVFIDQEGYITEAYSAAIEKDTLITGIERLIK